MEKVFTVNQLAEMWSYHPNTIRQMEEEGKLHRIPGLPGVRFSEKEVSCVQALGKDVEPLTAWERKQKDQEIAELKARVKSLECRLAKVVLTAQGV